MVSPRAWRLLLIGFLLAASVQLACAGSASPGKQPAEGSPLATQTRAVEGGVLPEEQVTPAPTEPLPATPLPAVLEARRLILEWPPVIREGDSDRVRLAFEVDQGGDLQITAEIPGNKVQSQTYDIPDLYETHNVFAEARLEMAGVQVEPHDLASQPLLRGQKVTFYWSVYPQEVGRYRGAVWFYLRFVPLGGGPESQRPITVQPIEIRSVNLLGLSSTPARILGAVGTLVGSVFGLDNVIPWVWKRVKKRDVRKM